MNVMTWGISHQPALNRRSPKILILGGGDVLFIIYAAPTETLVQVDSIDQALAGEKRPMS